MKQRTKRILTVVLVIILAAAAAWYTRPRSLTEMVGEDISCMSIAVTRFSNDHMGIGETRQKNYLPGGEDYETVSDLFGNLRFRRTILRDAAYHLSDLLGKYGVHEIHAGDYRGYFAFFTGEADTFALDLGYWDGEWSIHQKEQFHIIALANGEETALALHDTLWKLLLEESP